MILLERNHLLSDDLNKIETRMSEIIDRDVTTKREVWKRDEQLNIL